MKLRSLALFLFVHAVVSAQTIDIIPRPKSVMQPRIAASFVLSPATAILLEGSNMENSVAFLNDYLQHNYLFTLNVVKETKSDNVIRLNFERLDGEQAGAYNLTVNNKGVYIAGDNEDGVFYGIQTLIQLLPVPDARLKMRPNTLKIPHVSISDEPRFAYRGMHLDVSRHFFSVSFVKKYIDYLALHKMNYFHWHLTDDQGWRIEIKKYPKLTEVGGWRDGTIIGRYPGTGNDGIHYGGYYTQEEVKDVVAYAAKRYITVIPEIEMPGHSMAALTAYPELGTDPKAGYSVSQTWGINDVFNNVLNPSEYTFNFLQDVLDEVMPLFPAEYIHIGGDECSKKWWHESEFCQQLMKEKGIKDEHGLQSYFIQRIEKYVNSKGKKIIGWDEILEGGLAPNATVMSWRGEQGGIDAAKQHHNVIMTPGNPVYFDHTQSQNEDSVTIGGFNPIEKVYAYEPVPKELTAEESKYVLGAQANVWTEYMAYPSKIEYMIFPRMAALSEVLWTPKARKDSADFFRRLETQIKRYELWGSNYSKAWYDLKSSVFPAPGNNGLIWKLESKKKTDKIVYNTVLPSGKHFSYSAPVKITGNFTAQASIEAAGKTMPVTNVRFQFNKATGKKITLTEPPSSSYPGDGAFTLVNGVINEAGFARSREFIAYSGNDCEALIDLGKSQKISRVTVHALERKSSWIWAPERAEVQGSTDGVVYAPLGTSYDFQPAGFGVQKGKMVMEFGDTYSRYLKVKVYNAGKIPEGNPGSGKNAWLFVDEIAVD